jgi:hypothetical protein
MSTVIPYFKHAVKTHFPQQQESYPTYPVEMVSKHATIVATSTSATPIPEQSATTSPIPVFSQQRNTSPSKPSFQVPSRSNSATGVIPYISCQNGLQAHYQDRYLDICDAYTRTKRNYKSNTCLFPTAQRFSFEAKFST